MTKSKHAGIADTAAYGHALMCNRGGWTLREMLGADYEAFSGAEGKPFMQEDFQQSLEKVSKQTLVSSRAVDKK
jgi:hypothetical protein